jgi:ABC-type phosphate/phosphonate transport system ATPase subunit
MRHYVSVVDSGPAIDTRPAEPGGTSERGAALTLIGVVCGSRAPAPAAAAGVSLQVQPGQSVALLSQPGTAAADLVHVIGAVQRPRSGHVFVDDLAVHRLRGLELDRYRSSRGLLSTRWPLLPSLSVTDNVLAAGLSRRVDAATRERAAWLLSMTGAADIAAGPVRALTAEQQWRILIARALVQSPKLVLAEDPTPDLDPSSATKILDLLMEVHALLGFTLLSSISRVASATRYQRLVSMRDGAVIEDQLIAGDDVWTRGRVDRIG